MSECERYVSFANPEIEVTDSQGWEDSVPKVKGTNRLASWGNEKENVLAGNRAMIPSNPSSNNQRNCIWILLLGIRWNLILKQTKGKKSRVITRGIQISLMKALRPSCNYQNAFICSV